MSTTTGTLSNPYSQKLVVEHREWLTSFDLKHMKNWQSLLKNDIEAACCEAAVRRLLASFDIAVEPHSESHRGGGGPDFRCEANGKEFYIEVTCLLCSTATDKTGISEEPSGFSPFNPFGMVEAIFSKCDEKTRQCRRMNAPTLVAVGTFHSFAAMAGFNKTTVSAVLTGKTKMAWDIDISTAHQVGQTYQTTEFDNAAFLVLDPMDGVGFVRSAVSGLILCGLGISRWLGVLHPKPEHYFDPHLLPHIEFGRVDVDRATKKLHVNWPHHDAQ